MRGEILNVEIARRLDEVADLLREQGANPFRIQAYRHAAEILRELRCSVTAIVHKEDMAGLRKFPGIGDSLARSIHTLNHATISERSQAADWGLGQNGIGWGKLPHHRVLSTMPARRVTLSLGIGAPSS